MKDILVIAAKEAALRVVAEKILATEFGAEFKKDSFFSSTDAESFTLESSSSHQILNRKVAVGGLVSFDRFGNVIGP